MKILTYGNLDLGTDLRSHRAARKQLLPPAGVDVLPFIYYRLRTPGGQGSRAVETNSWPGCVTDVWGLSNVSCSSNDEGVLSVDKL